jgi:hypothetical protein
MNVMRNLGEIDKQVSITIAAKLLLSLLVLFLPVSDWAIAFAL